ncbi:molybdopterin molybdotransferase [Singulisphaera sp. GP187]|uniref:molybdopterin biosynthesis enzyme n=1 Tax=Singulisphaera sp. GP187 TaxID=1882752 RepID=UPI00092C883A|nr:molybdopterin biosynthesis enzyme [Singulisphaera sp. GP187]SIO44432.1 molybdopterin molybdotransferase [Singulisphaera sp. GP187]
MLSLAEARAQILERAEPGETIEVCLAEALGLVLAEPAVADVDLPPFDRAALDGYALRASDGRVETRLRVVGLHDDEDGAELEISADEAAHVAPGDPIPWGADAVLRSDRIRPEPDLGPPRLVEVLEPVEVGENLVPRGHYLRAGTELAPAGARVRMAMVGLFAAQGCVHPVCYRRVRVAVFAVGDHMVGPGEAPVMHRERNAAGATVVAPCLRWGATAHDLGAIAEDDLDAALSRALTAPIVVVMGRSTATLRRALLRAGVEPVISGVSIQPGKRMNYGVVVGPSGRVEHHVFHLPPSPIAALTVTSLLVGPLIARLQGGSSGPPLPSALSGPPPTVRPTIASGPSRSPLKSTTRPASSRPRSTIAARTTSSGSPAPRPSPCSPPIVVLGAAAKSSKSLPSVPGRPTTPDRVTRSRLACQPGAYS